MKAVKVKLSETHPDRVEAFTNGAKKYAEKIIANFKDYEFVRILPRNTIQTLMMFSVYWRGYEP